MFHCNEKFNVQIQPYLNKINHVFLFLCSVVTGLPTTKAPPLTLSKMGKRQRAKKVLSDSPGLVDFAIGLVNSVFNLPDGQVMFYGEFE